MGVNVLQPEEVEPEAVDFLLREGEKFLLPEDVHFSCNPWKWISCNARERVFWRT